MHYHDECDGLCCELKRNIKAQDWAVEIDPRHLRLGQQLGEGAFGVRVCARGNLQKSAEHAVCSSVRIVLHLRWPT